MGDSQQALSLFTSLKLIYLQQAFLTFVDSGRHWRGLWAQSLSSTYAVDCLQHIIKHAIVFLSYLCLILQMTQATFCVT